MNQNLRRQYLDAVKLDLMGPLLGEDEEIVLRAGSSPRDLYITGFLGPHDDREQLETDEEIVNEDDEISDPGKGISLASQRAPTSMGISFALPDSLCTIEATASGGFYKVNALKQDGQGESVRTWSRTPFVHRMNIDLSSVHGHESFPIPDTDLEWYVRAVHVRGSFQVTLVLCNTGKSTPQNALEYTLFQSCITVRVQNGGEFVPRPVQGGQQTGHSQDEDTRASDLLYRGSQEWAVGHSCAATWTFEDGKADSKGTPIKISSTWLPEQVVRAMSPSGDPCLAERSSHITGDERAAFDAHRLAQAPDASELRSLLEIIPDAYKEWLESQEQKARADRQIEEGGELWQTFIDHRSRAGAIVERMNEGIRILCENALARQAFQMSQRAMIMQLGWGQESSLPRAEHDRVELFWRPFQLGFILLTVAGLSGGSLEKPHGDREIMDLLWFPTGGGKTEAYLGLAAFTIFYRRLRDITSGEEGKGAGVTVLMRYTLRLLTIQQFERASRLIIACDTLRMDDPDMFGHEPISIGLWVGGAATPNKLKDAREKEFENTKQLTSCPVCGVDSLRWDTANTRDMDADFYVGCVNSSCDRAMETTGKLPVYTIDEMVYRVKPTLVIGTVDKFAQIVRKSDAGALLRNKMYLPPELIIQDELHLISGPLGTVTGLYEAAIDRICTRHGVRPKVVGSTATIRRATEQVRALFDRDVCQFPPPVLDADNSCFAIVDNTLPGRLYVGLSTAGRSPKFSLQHLGGALLQRAACSEGILKDAAEQDPYWTLLIYFNALRELGGALVMVHDDIPMTMKTLSSIHGTSERQNLEHLELSSRLGAIDIPHAIEELGKKVPDQIYDVVLATNMISVGVDISRLGLMVVNGQPKSMSEYIQASSRVGRNALAGLVFTVYNVGRPRDRSHYESFRSWHQALYSAVEASSVTPFSARARDRALHACLVALARHVVAREHDNLAELHNSPKMYENARAELDLLVEHLAQRGARAMSHVVGGQGIRRLKALESEIIRDCHAFLDIWERNQPKEYWNDHNPDCSLLISAEEAAATNWNGVAQATPNSMREVEPSVVIRLSRK